MPDETIEQEVQETLGEEIQEQGEEQQPEEMLASKEPQELPENASERTKREFEKLKEHNRKLAEENKTLKGVTTRPGLLETYGMNQFSPPAPQVPVQMPANLTQEKVEQIKQEVFDSEGYVNQAELERRLSLASQAEERARQAEERANQALEKVARFEVNAQARELYAQFPELDPSRDDVFNEEAYELVQAELLKQLVDTGKQDAISAAGKMSKYFRKPQISQTQKETLQARSQQSVTGTGKTAGPSGIDDTLRRRSMFDQDAMDERIRLAGI